MCSGKASGDLAGVLNADTILTPAREHTRISNAWPDSHGHDLRGHTLEEQSCHNFYSVIVSQSKCIIDTT